VAKGQGGLSDFEYTIDASGTMATTSLPSTWGTAKTGCWITKPGGSC
jgi:type IV pilus assembly protein PilE